MVFENLTLFELNFEDAQFGPERIGAETDEPVEATAVDEPEETGGFRRFLLLFGASLVVSVAAALAARRFLGSEDDGDGGIEIEDVDSGVESAVEN